MELGARIRTIVQARVGDCSFVHTPRVAFMTSVTERSFTNSHESPGMRISWPRKFNHVYKARKPKSVVRSLGREKRGRACVVCGQWALVPIAPANLQTSMKMGRMVNPGDGMVSSGAARR